MISGDYGTAQYSTWPRNGTVGHSASQLPLTTQSNAATVTHGANNMTGITPTCFANDNYDNAETMQNMSSNMDVGMCDSPEHSGGVTPCSGRVTPAHFFVSANAHHMKMKLRLKTDFRNLAIIYF